MKSVTDIFRLIKQVTKDKKTNDENILNNKNNRLCSMINSIISQLI